ncbi:MAG TPA: hypothetical protein VJM33_13825 [Microthrixaceae bacterium]|nr:hypothetical protein [Microthrixaceae bacterium]
MSNVEVFRGRDARSAAVERHPASGQVANATLREQFEIATSIANATEAVPKSYRKQPGAVLLAIGWAQEHDVSLLTAIQNVAFIEGKAVVDASMQRALAKRAGYELEITVSDHTAAVHILQGGKALGSASYSMEDARQAGLADKNNWRRNPEDMLVARATTRAIRRFAPDVLLGLVSSDEVDEPADVVELAEVGGVGSEEPESRPVPTHPVSDEQGESDGPPAPSSSPPASAWADENALRDDLRARGLTVADAVRESYAITETLGIEDRAGNLRAIHRHPSPEFVQAFAAWVANHDVVTESAE